MSVLSPTAASITSVADVTTGGLPGGCGAGGAAGAAPAAGAVAPAAPVDLAAAQRRAFTAASRAQAAKPPWARRGKDWDHAYVAELARLTGRLRTEVGAILVAGRATRALAARQPVAYDTPAAVAAADAAVMAPKPTKAKKPRAKPKAGRPVGRPPSPKSPLQVRRARGPVAPLADGRPFGGRRYAYVVRVAVTWEWVLVQGHSLTSAAATAGTYFYNVHQAGDWASYAHVDEWSRPDGWLPVEVLPTPSTAPVARWVVWSEAHGAWVRTPAWCSAAARRYVNGADGVSKIYAEGSWLRGYETLKLPRRGPGRWRPLADLQVILPTPEQLAAEDNL